MIGHDTLFGKRQYSVIANISKTLCSYDCMNFLIRFALAYGVKVLCNFMDWKTLRFIVSDAYLYFSGWLGLNMHRVAFDTIHWDGNLYQFTPACTMIDAFFMVVPLAWNLKYPVVRNIIRFSIFFVCLSLLNLLRLELGAFLLHFKVPWLLSHEAIYGVCCFMLFLWVVDQGNWIPAHWLSGKVDEKWR